MAAAEKPDWSPERFETELHAVCERAAGGECGDAINRLFVRWHGHIPDKYRGDGDRTYGYFFVTTIIRTLGDDGVRLASRFWLPGAELAHACYDMLGHDVPADVWKDRIRGRYEPEGDPSPEQLRKDTWPTGAPKDCPSERLLSIRELCRTRILQNTRTMESVKWYSCQRGTTRKLLTAANEILSAIIKLTED